MEVFRARSHLKLEKFWGPLGQCIDPFPSWHTCSPRRIGEDEGISFFTFGGLYGVYVGIMEKNMETTKGLGFGSAYLGYSCKKYN